MKMNSEKIAKELKKLTVEIAPGFNESDISSETRFIDDLLFDSLMIMELVVRAEDLFGVTIEELNVEKIGVFGELCDMIAKEVTDDDE